MVRALLDGRKTQTRRIIKPQPPEDVVRHCWYHAPLYGFTRDTDLSNDWHVVRLAAEPGDRLWVKETWRAHAWHADCVEIAYAAQRGLVGWSEQHTQITYPSGNRNAFKYYAPKGPDFWRPSIFLPRWASRLTLIVTDVRVERLQDISEEDAAAEGWPAPEQRAKTGIAEIKDAYPIGWYAWLWDQINGRGAWANNPWVAAYTFRVIKQNIDQIEKVAA